MHWYSAVPPTIGSNSIRENAAAADRSVRATQPEKFFFSSRRRHTRLVSDWSSDVCSSNLVCRLPLEKKRGAVVVKVGVDPQAEITFVVSNSDLAHAGCNWENRFDDFCD